MKKDKLEALLGQEPEEVILPPTRKINLFSQAYITNWALKKARTYAELACDVLEESVECYGYLITPKEVTNRVVRDVYLAPNQKVSSAGVEVSGKNVIKAGREIDKLDYKVLGWWHSHADFGTFHSITDDENMMKILNAIAPINYVIQHKQIPLFSGKLGIRRRGNSLEIYDKNNPTKKINLDILKGEHFNSKELASIQGIRVNIPIRVGFAYSIVVNANGDKPYCEIATKNFCDLCNSENEKSKQVRLRVVDGPRVKINKREMIKEIKKKIQKPKYTSPITLKSDINRDDDEEWKSILKRLKSESLKDLLDEEKDEKFLY